MKLEELAPLQEQFSTYHRVMRQDPYLALFTSEELDGEISVYMAGPNVTMLERHAPGGWVDCAIPTDEELNLVVGREDCWDRLKLRRPATAA
jgi:hypothetical protein